MYNTKNHPLQLERTDEEIINILESKYSKNFIDIENSPLSKVREIKPHDRFVLGTLLETFSNEIHEAENDGTVSNLGVLPRIGLDVITGFYGASILPIIASTQMLDGEVGQISYMVTKAVTNRNTITAGQVIKDPRTRTARLIGNYSPEAINVEIGDYAAGTQTYSFNLATLAGGTTGGNAGIILPIRLQSVRVTVDGTSFYAQDDGYGHIQGPGISGVIDYTTGAGDISFFATKTQPPVGSKIRLSFGTRYENVPNSIPKISTTLETRPVHAVVYALSQEISMLKKHGLKTRFEYDAVANFQRNLTYHLTKEIGNHAIFKLYNEAQGGVITWDAQVPAGISWTDHVKSFPYHMNKAEESMYQVAGRGKIDVIIAGNKAATFLTSQGSLFQPSGASYDGPHYFGTWKGSIPVIKAPLYDVNGTPAIPDNELILMYKGTGGFDTTLVYAPYMPLTMTSISSSPETPLMQQQTVATWAALEVVAPKFITKMTIENLK